MAGDRVSSSEGCQASFVHGGDLGWPGLPFHMALNIDVGDDIMTIYIPRAMVERALSEGEAQDKVMVRGKGI